MLDNYKNINEKDSYFNNQSNIELNVFWDILIDLEYKNKEDDKKLFVFRGLSNAKYKLYNSAQRLLNEHDYYYYKNGLSNTYKSIDTLNWMVEFTDNLKQGSEGWKGGIIKKYLSTLKDPTDVLNKLEYFTYLSYLRHHNVPTPVIDVSYNPFVALYFALSDFHKSATNEEIDNYFSFYIFDLHLMNKYEKEHQLLRTVDSMLHDKFQTLRNVQISSMFNNLNIINQEGCLISNISLYPLERDYENKKNMFISNSVISKGLKDELKKKRIISCYNMHKCTIPFFKQKLDKLGITKDFLFPNPYKLKDEIVDEAIVKFLNFRCP